MWQSMDLQCDTCILHYMSGTLEFAPQVYKCFLEASGMIVGK